MPAAAKDLDGENTDDNRNGVGRAGYAAYRTDLNDRGYDKERPETPVPNLFAYVMYRQCVWRVSKGMDTVNELGEATEFLELVSFNCGRSASAIYALPPKNDRSRHRFRSTT